jgi:hypothetical protein
VSPAELALARQIGLDRRAEARESAVLATVRLARRERRLQNRLVRASAQAGARD